MSNTVYFNLKSVTGSKDTALDRLRNVFGRYGEEGSSEAEGKSVLYSSRMDMLRVAVKDFLDPTAGMTDAQRERFIKKLYAKIQSGAKLTPDEMQYLRKYDPVTYMKVARIQAQREAFERQLESCKSKEEAQELYIDRMTRVPKEDPARKELLAAYDNVYEKFRESGDYRALPETEEEEKEDGIEVEKERKKKNSGK